MYVIFSAICCFARLGIMQASHQLRFLREWAVFGRALRRSVWELLGVGFALLLLLLVYAHTGHLVRVPSWSLYLFLQNLTHTNSTGKLSHNEEFFNIEFFSNSPSQKLQNFTPLLNLMNWQQSSFVYRKCQLFLMV